ncbi:MAG: Gldg family protein [Actinomycetota bacterium]
MRARRGVSTLFGLELRRLFRSPLAFVFAAIFFFLTGYTGMTALLSTREATARYAINSMAVLFLICIPVLTMRSFSEERSSGRLDFLLASPLSTARIVLGKYLGAVSFASLLVAVAIGVQLFPVLRLGRFDAGEIAGGFLGLELFAAAAVAVSLLWSAACASMLVAALGAIVTLLVLWFAGSAASGLPGPLDEIVQRAAFAPRLEPFTFGLIRTDHLAYFALVVLLPLLGTVAVLSHGRPRWPRRQPARKGHLAQHALVTVTLVGLAVLVAGPVQRVDLTAGRRLTLSGETREVLNRLSGGVDILAFLDPSQPDFREARNLLRLYDAYSSKLNVRVVDLRKDPQVAARYGVQQSGEVVVRSNGREQWASRATEDRVTVALARLSGASSGLACLALPVDPPGPAPAGFGRLRKLLVDSGFDVSDADGTVPAGCDVAVIGPGRRSSAWTASLQQALAAAPTLAVILLAEPGQENPLADVLGEAAVAIEDGIIHEPEAGATGDPTILLVQTPSSQFGRSLTLVLPGAGALRIPTGTSVLAETSPSSMLVSDSEVPSDAKRGTMPVAALVVDGYRRVAVVGDADFSKDDFLRLGDNADFVLDLTTRVLGRKPVVVGTRRVGLASTSLLLSADSAKTARLYTTILVPVAFLLAGVIIHFMRRSS